jgi:aspartate 1-decarboxylase
MRSIKMLRYKLLSKLHRATVTECDLNYNARIIVVNYGLMDEAEMETYQPRIIILGEGNEPVK